MTSDDPLHRSEPEWSANWKYFTPDFFGRPEYAHYLRLLLRRHRLDARTFLETGAGSFKDTANLAQLGYDSVGIDFSPQAVHNARRAWPTLADRFQPGDAFRLPFPDRHFDVTFNNGFLIHFDDAAMRRLLAEQQRVTRHLMVVTVFSALNRARLERVSFEFERTNLPRYRFFTPEELLALLPAPAGRPEILPYGHLLLRLLLTRTGHLPTLAAGYAALRRTLSVLQWERFTLVWRR